MEGWLKLHRKILKSAVFQNPNDLKIWVWMICKASIKKRTVTLKIGKGFRQVEIQRGQFIFGRGKAQEALDLDESLIYRTLQRFQDINKAISIQPNNQFSIVTVLNFDEYQTEEEEDFLEFEEDRTSDEQAMNNQRTTNEQQTNNTRTAGEQQANTNNKVNNGEIVKEGQEGEEREIVTPADAAVPPTVILFPEPGPADAGTSPSGSAPVSPSGNTPAAKKRKAREDRLGRFLESYSQWMEDEHGMKAKIDGTNVNAAKSIISYFQTSIVSIANREQVKLEEKDLDNRIIIGWEWFLKNYKKVEPFHQDAFLRLVDINSKFQILYKQIKNGTAKQQQQSSGGESKLRQAEGVVATIIGRNRREGQSSAAGSGEAI